MKTFHPILLCLRHTDLFSNTRILMEGQLRKRIRATRDGTLPVGRRSRVIPHAQLSTRQEGCANSLDFSIHQRCHVTSTLRTGIRTWIMGVIRTKSRRTDHE